MTAEEGGVPASIVIPTRNRPELLRAAVASAISALPEGGEVLVTDDRGTPPAAAALADIRNSALRIVTNDGARGAAPNRNHGVRAARGRIVFFLDDDDLMLPGYPAAILARLAREPAHVWGFSATAEHASGAPPAAAASGYGDARVLAGGPLRRRLAGLGCGFWIARARFLALGGIDETLTVNEDTEFSLRLLAAGHPPLYSPVPGVSLLKHGQGQITRATPPEERARCFRAILDRHAAFLAADRRGRRHLVRRLLKMQAKSGRLVDGARTAATEGPGRDRLGNLLYLAGNWALYRLKR